MSKIKLISALLIFVFLPINLNLLAPNPAEAANDTSIVIQPAKIEVSGSPGQKIARSFSIINRSNFTARLKLVVKDYKQISEEGRLEFYDAEKEKAALWLVPQFLEIGLKPLETREIGVVINVPEDFSTGGHYGAILFQPIGDSQGISTNNFGELVLLTVTGGNTKTTAIVNSVSLSTGFWQQGNPVYFDFKMQNTGNTHFDAQSKLILKDWLGKEIGNYNTGQLTIYPKTSRVFKWRWNGTPYMGIYKAEVMISDPASANKFKTIDGKWFFIFPWQIILALILLAAIIFVLVKYRRNILTSKFQKKLAKNGMRIKDLANSVNDVISVPVKKIFR